MNILKRITSLLTLGAFLVAQWPSVAFSETSVQYLYNDARSTPVAAADEQGNVLWRKHYRPFGAEVELTGDEAEAVADDRGFTGHTYDRESGLVYMGARYYNPRLGVFYSTDPAPVDPVVPMTFNRYIYVRQNPYRFVDPDGEDAVDALIGYSIGIFNGAAIAATAVITGLNSRGHDGGAQMTANVSAVEFAPQPGVWSPNALDDADFRAGVEVGKAVGSLAVTLAGFTRSKACFIAGTQVRADSGWRSIEELEVGDRVRTYHDGHTQVSESAWARVALRVRDADNPTHVVDVTRLADADQLTSLGMADLGAEVSIRLPELGVNGIGTVTGIKHGVRVENGPGRVVLATYSSLSNDVHEVSFVGDRKSLQGTGSHPLYSLDREEWVRIRNLQVGERLQTAEGAVTVEALEKVRGVHRVYNLEVEGDHEYLVGEAGVRAHNNGCGDGIVYLRTNKATGKEYVGKTTRGRFDARKAEHHTDNPGKKYDFDVLEEVPAGGPRRLDVAEADWIRAGGGPAKKGGRLEKSELGYGGRQVSSCRRERSTMSAWGSGPWSNDAARDFVFDLKEATGLAEHLGKQLAVDVTDENFEKVRAAAALVVLLGKACLWEMTLTELATLKLRQIKEAGLVEDEEVEQIEAEARLGAYLIEGGEGPDADEARRLLFNLDIDQ